MKTSIYSPRKFVMLALALVLLLGPLAPHGMVVRVSAVSPQQ